MNGPDRDLNACTASLRALLPLTASLAVSAYAHSRELGRLFTEQFTASDLTDNERLRDALGEISDCFSSECLPNQNPYLAAALSDPSDAGARMASRRLVSALGRTASASACRVIAARLAAEKDDRGKTAADKLLDRVFSFRPTGEKPTLVCPPGKLPEEAAGRFTAFLGSKRGAELGDDFVSAAQEVADGESELCVLPIGNSSDGPLSSFRLLALRSGLVLCLACRVSADGGKSSSTFGMYSKNPVTLPPFRAPGQSYTEPESFFSIVLPPSGEGEAGVGELIETAEFFGLSLNNTASFPISYTDGEYSLELTFRVPFADPLALPAMAIYLSLFRPSFSLSGIYRMI